MDEVGVFLGGEVGGFEFVGGGGGECDFVVLGGLDGGFVVDDDLVVEDVIDVLFE